MELSIIKYPAIDAKLKAMYSRNLSKEDILELSRQPDIPSVISTLKNKFEPLEQIKDKATRVEIEDSLDKVLIKDISKIQIYLTKHEKNIVFQFVSKYEIKCLKSALKNLISSSKIENNMADVDEWTSTIFKNIKELSSANTLSRYLSIVKNSTYYSTIIKYVDESNADILNLERALDVEYFKTLYSKVEKENMALKELIGKKIDLLNLIWIMRGKTYYKKSCEELEKLLIPINYDIRKSTLIDLANCDNYEDAKNIISQTAYKRFANIEIDNLEKEMKIYFKHECEKILKQSKFNLSFVFAYIILSEFQKENIVHIIGSVYYKLNKKEIEKELIL